ncbi:hypothetical protein [Hyalangium rubrum]|uniref:Uncharacterized protein n=1 Tax=Hyalangium rubrum TaxID=3103134 RepID=A0ABU5H297_9BACT|nr:hypothetical protein [Hyalangium sp. s54d21]MDY7227600.1 hypothetical protein [Hyalangium sp. s54d21]
MHRSVAFTPDDTREWGLPLAGPGLLLDVPQEGPWAQRPALHFDAVPGYRLRLSSGGQPLLWLRIDGWWDRCGFLRGAPGVPSGLPPLSASEVREVTHAPDSSLWWEAWMWRMGRALAQPEHPMLHAGRWCLRPVRAIRAPEADRYPISTMEWRFGQPPSSPHSLEGILRFERFWVEDWTAYGPPSEEGMFQGAVVPLRAPSSEEDGRVKSWRKRARDGTLPPALLLYVDLLGKWLLLDGHDRVHAALLENVVPPLLGLWPVHEEVLPSSPEGQQGVLQAAEFHLRDGAPPSVVNRVNRMLLLNFQGSRRSTVTRAWPMKGGLSAWRAEVLASRRWNPFPADSRDWEWFVSPC